MLFAFFRKWWVKRLVSKATLALESEDWAEAAAVALEAIRADDDSVDARMVLGTVRSMTGDNASAIKCYIDVIARQPDHSEAKSSLAMIYARTRQWAKALAIVEELAAEHPERPEHAEALKMLHAKMNSGAAPSASRSIADIVRSRDWPLLKQTVEGILERDPANISALLHLGMAHYRMNAPSEALNVYDKALMMIRSRPEKTVVEFNRGTVLMQLSRWAEACDLFEELAALNDTQRGKLAREPVLYSLAFCYRQRKLIKMARTTYENLYDINPKFKDVAECLRRLRVPLAAQVRELHAKVEASDELCGGCMKPLPVGAMLCPLCGWHDEDISIEDHANSLLQ